MDLRFLPVLLLVTVVGVQLIGVRVGWRRGLLAAWVGLATAGLLLTAIGGESRSTVRVAAVAGLGVVAMLAWAAIFELVAGPASDRPGPRRLNPVQSTRDAFARGHRKAEIALIAARYGLGRYTRRGAPEPRGVTTGRALRAALQRAGGVYVKLGQFLSTRPDVVSAEIATELRELQQHVERIPERAVHQVLAGALGDHLQKLGRVDMSPVAAASVAQVHRAVLPDGRVVAVKVQRPDVERRVRCDVDILIRLAFKLERRTRWARTMQLAHTVRDFAANVLAEIDFRHEADNLVAMATAVARHPRFVVPAPVTDLSRGHVLTMEWVDGRPIVEAAHGLPHDERITLARDVLHCFLDQIVVVGTFHADPHPGNLYLTPDGRVALIDCGTVGHLDRGQRRALQSVLTAIAAEDAVALHDALRGITTTPGATDDALLDRALGRMLALHLGVGATPGAELMTDLMLIMRDFGLAFDPVVAGAVRAIATLQATLELLEPGLDMIHEARGYAKRMMRDLASPVGSTAREQLESVLPTLLPTLMGLPGRLERLLGAAERQELTIGVHLFPGGRDRQFAEHLTAQVTATFAAFALGVIGGLLVIAAALTTESDSVDVLRASGVGCVAIAVLVLLSAITSYIRQRR